MRCPYVAARPLPPPFGGGGWPEARRRGPTPPLSHGFRRDSSPEGEPCRGAHGAPAVPERSREARLLNKERHLLTNFTYERQRAEKIPAF